VHSADGEEATLRVKLRVRDVARKISPPTFISLIRHPGLDPGSRYLCEGCKEEAGSRIKSGMTRIKMAACRKFSDQSKKSRI
jgi:hypothetical protein